MNAVRSRVSSLELGITAVLAILSAGVLLAMDTPTIHRHDRDGLKVGNRITDVTDGRADFFIGDLPVSKTREIAFGSGLGSELLNLPTAATATVPSYNVPGMASAINFSPTVLSAIWLGQITRWNDALIRKDNPGLHFPSEKIVLIDQMNENGGTDAWTTYLTEFSPEWKKTIGRTRVLDLPISTKTSGTEETAQLIAATPYSFSFVELWSGKKLNLQLGRVKNQAGRFVKASISTICSAVESVTQLEDPQPLLAAAKAEQAYPVASFTWIAVPVEIPDPLKREKVVAMVKWILTDGQISTAKLFYAPLPSNLVNLELRSLSHVH